MKYQSISEGVEAKVENGKLYVRYTNYGLPGMLERGGVRDRIICMPYQGNLSAAQIKNEFNVNDIDRLIEYDGYGGATVINNGSIIS